MTSAEDRNDRLTTQKKLEWVTPQISLMGAVGVTENGSNGVAETGPGGAIYAFIGPS